MERNSDKKRGFGSSKPKFKKADKSKKTSDDSKKSSEKDSKASRYDSKKSSGKTSKRKEGTEKYEKKFADSKPKRSSKPQRKQASDPNLVRLNKFIANSGICSRREADQLIEQGLVTVNGEVVVELGTKIHRKDKVVFDGKHLKGEQLVYLLLNKPKDYITTSKDPQGRKTVMDLVGKACKERIYPVGRLDRNTTGLLMLTNDGDLASKLTHPKNHIKKLYQVQTDKSVKPSDLSLLMSGVTLEDGETAVDNAAYVDGKKNVIGVELHSGKNRIVRRLFAELGYDVKKLDRVMFADLTKREIPRGKWRFLSEKEVAYLKML